jgi:7-cyano-7-deazaguanine synthase
MKPTVVIVSGGMDSVTLLHKVVAEVGPNNVKAISFDYGQVHKKELGMAAWQCEQLGVDHKIVDITNLNELLPSTLTDGSEVPQGHYESESMKKTVVPFRNSIISTISLGYAAGLHFERIALGVHSGDHYIYPDCRPEFIAALSELARLGDFSPIAVYAPYLKADKTQIIAEGIELGVDYAHTWTSYSAGDTPDYKTGSSVERTQAFIANGIPDPLYTPEQWEEAKAYAETITKE